MQKRHQLSFGRSLGAAMQAVIPNAGGDPTGTYPFVAIPFFGIWWWIAGVPEKVYLALWPDEEPI